MRQSPESVCIVIHPRLLNGDFAFRLAGRRGVMIFDDLDAFDRWRRRCGAADTLACEVEQALREIDCVPLPQEIARTIERLAAQRIAPKVSDLLKNEHSERTFYRRWNRAVPVRPKRFLDRVRFLHALRLIEEYGCCVKEAAALAGYGSVERFRADRQKSQ